VAALASPSRGAADSAAMTAEEARARRPAPGARSSRCWSWQVGGL